MLQFEISCSKVLEILCKKVKTDSRLLWESAIRIISVKNKVTVIFSMP